MAEKAYQIKSKAIETKPPGRQMQAEPSHVLPEKQLIKVEFIITTYPELQPFLEMAVLLLEGVYELNS